MNWQPSRIAPPLSSIVVTRALTAFCALLFLSRGAQAQSPIVDHCGQDWSPSTNAIPGCPGPLVNGGSYWGEHRNINSFILPQGWSINLTPSDGTYGGYLIIKAKRIQIEGTIDGHGCGYAGGGGGGGGGGADGGAPGTHGAGGVATAGSTAGSNGADGTDPEGGNGGHGGLGSGPAGGTGGGGGQRGISASNQARDGADAIDGGYYAIGSNGDPNNGDDVRMGSGGGGGGGGGGGHSANTDAGGAGGGGGGGGGRGGGLLELYGDYYIVISGSGLIIMNGDLGGDAANGRDGTADGGNGGRGGSAAVASGGGFGIGGAGARDSLNRASGPGGYGGFGGVGAGGGVLLLSPVITDAGTIRSLGGGWLTGNGGTVKLRYGTNGLSGPGPISAGAYFGTNSVSVTLPMPTISPFNPPTSTDPSATVTIGNPDPDVPNLSLHYTVDGSAPDCNSTPYTGPFSVSANIIVKAIACAPGWKQSSASSSTITFQCVSPNISPLNPAPTTDASVPVTLSYSGPSISGLNLRYTSDGNSPDCNATPYGGPFAVSVNTTVKAIACAPGRSASDPASSAITFYDACPPAISLSPPKPASTFYLAQAVQVQISSCSLPNLAVRYTLDGSDPDQNSATYVAPFNVTSNVLVKARTFVGGRPPSAIVSEEIRYAIYPGDEVVPPGGASLAALPANGPALAPATGALWDVRLKKLYAADPGTNLLLLQITWKDALTNALVDYALIAPWPTNAAVGFPTNQAGAQLYVFLRLKNIMANDLLATAFSLAYQKNGTNAFYTNSTTILNLALADVDQAMSLLQQAMQQAPYIQDLVNYDQQRGLTGEGSAVRTLVGVFETYLQAAEFKSQILNLRAMGKGEASPEFVQARQFLADVQQQVNVSYAIMAGALTDTEQSAAGLPYLLDRIAGLRNAFSRLLVFLPETSGEVLRIENYVPNPSIPATDELQYARDALNQALTSWQEAQVAQRQYDTDQTALRDQLAQLGAQYLDRLQQLTGKNPDYPQYYANGVIFGSAAVVQAYLDDATATDTAGGELHRQQVLADQAAANLDLAKKTQTDLGKRIEIEQRKRGRVADTLQGGNLQKLTMIDVARATASAFSKSVKFKTTKAGDTTVAEWEDQGSYNPGAAQLGKLSQQEREILAKQQVDIRNAESGAFVENLKLDQAQAQIQENMADKGREAARLSVKQIKLEVNQVIKEYQRANTNLAGAYFSNPAYRLLRDQTVSRAERNLASARAAAYRFARRLEYEWAERWPIGLNTADPQWQANKDTWSTFIGSLETVFTAANPFEVQDYFNALREWDRQLRLTRPTGDVRAQDYGSRISLRQDIIGLDDYDSWGNLLPGETIKRNRQLFREFVLGNVISTNTGGFFLNSPGKTALLLRFPLNLLSRDSKVSTYFTASISYNQKIENFDFNLVGTSGLRSPGGGPTARIVLLQRGTAALRTLRSTQVPGDYSVLLMDADPFVGSNPDLIWGNPNFAIYDNATINNGGRLVNYQPGSSVAMQNRPVAASEWTLFIDNGLQDGNLTLAFDKLSDIEMMVSFHRNNPPSIW
jgi:hypothetical protein